MSASPYFIAGGDFRLVSTARPAARGRLLKPVLLGTASPSNEANSFWIQGEPSMLDTVFLLLTLGLLALSLWYVKRCDEI